MVLARIEGNLTATRRHPSLQGWRLLICQPLNAAGQAEGVPTVALNQPLSPLSVRGTSSPSTEEQACT